LIWDSAETIEYYVSREINMEGTSETGNSKSHLSRRRWLIISGITVAMIIGIGLIHVFQVRHVKHMASGIKLGDTRDQVVKLLGRPRTTYSTGFPAQGGAATKWGSCYGSFLHTYQKPENWPVVIEFDKDGIVIEVKQNGR
jgi:hypothetical protein